MARLAITTDAGAVLGYRTIPDDAIPLIRRAVGGATNQETAANLLDWAMPVIRSEVRSRLLAERWQQDTSAATSGQSAEGQAFDGDWPG
jgi:hypothetical protein